MDRWGEGLSRESNNTSPSLLPSCSLGVSVGAGEDRTGAGTEERSGVPYRELPSSKPPSVRGYGARVG